MKYTLQDLQENKVYIEITCDEDFDKLLPYTNIVGAGTNIKHDYPYYITLCEDFPGWTDNDKYFWNQGYDKMEIKDVIINLKNQIQEEIKTKLLTFTIDGETIYNLEIKWEDWELLKQGNKLKLL